MDLGSVDGTLEVLREIEAHNPKVKIVQSKFYEQDAAIFAHLANDLIAVCENPHVLYFQADEVWHQDLIKLTHQALRAGERDLSFWRVQLKYNFQRIKQFPQVVHRIAPRGNFEFVGDGMNSKRAFDAKMVSTYGMEYFTQWGDKFKNNPVALPTNEMILDVSLNGGFVDNVPDRRRMHLPFWHEGEVMPEDEGEVLSIDDWYNKHRDNQEWDLHSTKFNIPEIMHYHLGRRKYTLRDRLLEMLKLGDRWR
jgi:hypothetical protein